MEKRSTPKFFFGYFFLSNGSTATEQKRKKRETANTETGQEGLAMQWRKDFQNRPLCLRQAPRATQKTRSLLFVTEWRVTRRHSPLRLDSSRAL